ncbi:MAG: hypothetical protein AB7P07_01325 [Hyphomonadaceae bacterium]
MRLSRRSLHLIAALVIVALAIGLYKAKTDAARAEAHVRDLRSQIAETEADMRALRAEIAHLESPARVEDLAGRHLELDIGGAGQALPERAITRSLPPPQNANSR